MKRLFHVLALCALLPTAALSRTAMETNQLVDDNGVPIGTATNPLYTAGGTGSVTAAGTNGTTAPAVHGFSGVVPVPVSGTFFQATQPVSGTFWQATQPVSGTFWQATQPVSAASLPLPSGASTESTLSALNTTTGTQADAQWSGSGNGTVLALLKYNAAYTLSINNVLYSIKDRTRQPTAGTNRSTTVGTTASTPMAANGSRGGWKVKNDTTGDIWINFYTTATAAAGGGNIKVPAGGYLASEPGFVETGAMSAIGSAAGLNITILEF